jgi:hypothetical protein
MQTLMQNTIKNPWGAFAFGTLALLGAFKVATFSISMLRFLKANYLRSQYNLLERYGKTDSWALVTGGSDGVGLEICEQMAA